MATEKLQVEVTANVQEAVKGVAILEKQLERLQKIASLPNLSFRQQEKLNALLLTTQRELNKFGRAADVANKSTDAFPKSAGQATTTLVNFNRVVQDAPFGLLGIANNIEPLLSSFQSLSKETGSGKNALKALVSAFSGPAGVIFAVSAASSALIAFGPQIEAALSGITKFDKGLIEGLKGGAEAAKKAQIEFGNYVSIINDSNSSAERQKDALNDVNRALAEYGIKINSVAAFQKNSAQISALYIQLKQEEAKAQVLAAKAAEEYAKQIEAAFKGAKAGQKGGVSGFASNNPLAQFFALQQFFADKTIKKSEELEVAFTKASEESSKRVQNIIAAFTKIAGVQEDFGDKTDKNTSKVFKYTNAINGLKSALEDFQNLDLEKIAEAQSKIFNLDPTIKLAPKPQQGIDINRADRTSSLVLTPEALKRQSEYQTQLDAINEKLALQRELVSTISGTINNGIAAGIDTFFNALANNQDPFEALQQSVKRLVVELAAAVVKMLVLKALSAAITGGGSAGAGLLGGLTGGGGGTGIVRADQLRLLLGR